MCFSATASFGASALLGGVGAKALKEANTPGEKLFAMTPVLFAAQQLVEGFLWVTLSNNPGANAQALGQVLTLMFLFFAWVIWPTFIPLFNYLLEKRKTQKRILLGMVIWGIIISIFLFYTLYSVPILSEIRAHHIFYGRVVPFPNSWILGTLYFIPIVSPFFISSTPKMWYLGMVNVLAFVLSMTIFKSYLISVWCFFGAVASVFVLVVLLELRNQKQVQNALNYTHESQ